MADIDRFCERMRYWCEDASLGYDQGNRWDIRDGGECDCSSLVVFALREAGFDTGKASYTGNIASELCARGWSRVACDGNPRKGDLLLSEGNHVAAWLGDCLAQASIDENGNITGGASGDQSGRETNTRSYYSYPWTCYLRYGGASGSSDASGEWQGDVVGREDTTGAGDDYAGVFGKPIKMVAIDGVGDYQAHSNGRWYPTVNRYDLNDEDGGMAGNFEPIDAVRIFDSSVCYQTHNLNGDWNDVMRGTTDTGGSSDDFAGDFGVAQDAIRIWRDSGEQPRYNVFS